MDTGTTRIRGALTATTGLVTYSQARVPIQSSTTLRAYAADLGQLYSLEAGTGGISLVARDVASAIAGAPTSTTTTITGVPPYQPQAIVWTPSGNLLVLDQALSGRNWVLQLLSITPGGVSSPLWTTQPLTSFPAGIFLSLGGFREVVLSLNLAGGAYEALSLRSDDGQPLRSIGGIGVLHGPVVSDGAGFTVPLSQTPTETQPNVYTIFIDRDTTSPSLCGTSYFRAQVGDQSTQPLGNPAIDCP